LIIGIHGHARVGKDTLGGYLIEHFKARYRREFVQAAFATQLKNMCKEHFNLTDDQLWGDKKEELDKRYYKPISPNSCGLGLSKLPSRYWTAREIMQEVGSFYRRIYYDFWVKDLDDYLINNNIKDAIITDVRHINECEYVKNNNGVLIRVLRECVEEIHGMRHESETSLDDKPIEYFDIEINNASTLDDLYNAAEETASAILMIEKLKNEGRRYNGE